MLVFPIGTRFKHDNYDDVFVKIIGHQGGEKCEVEWSGVKRMRRNTSLTTSTLVRKWEIMLDSVSCNQVPIKIFEQGVVNEQVEEMKEDIKQPIVEPVSESVTYTSTKIGPNVILSKDLDSSISKNFGCDDSVLSFDETYDALRQELGKLPKLKSEEEKHEALFSLEFDKFRNWERKDPAGFCVYLREMNFGNSISNYTDYREHRLNS